MLFQTGDLQVEYHAGKAVKTTAPSGALDCTLMFHLFRDEVPTGLWDSFDGIAAFFRILGVNSTSYLGQVWSVAFFERNRRCGQDKATYYLHGFLKVPGTKHLELLRLSGLKGFYCSSRSPDRSVDPAQYSVVRKRLLPGALHSSDSEGGGDKRFRLLGVPRSIDRPVLKRVLGWKQRLCVREDFKVGLLRQLWHLLAVLS